MQIHLSNARILDQRSPFHKKLVSLAIKEGVITSISIKPTSKPRDTIDLKGAWVTPGLVDLSCALNDPGYEHKEDIKSGLAAAVAGGFVQVCVIPNSDPVMDSKSGLEYLMSKSKEEVTSILPIAALSKNHENESLSELLDLNDFGAVAFSGGLQPITNAELMLNALRYTSKFDGLIINRPLDTDLSRFGQMHEGVVSTVLGLKGISDIAETVMIKRDLEILRYTGGKIHFSGISSKKSVQLIRQAKNEGLKVTCDVPIHNLIFTDERLDEFDSNFKTNPPLRTESDRKSLVAGLKTDVIDAISSDHQPQDTESKNLEFDLADFGMTSLQTFIPNIIKLSEEIDMEILIHKISNGPRRILGMEDICIEQKKPAILTIIDPKSIWVLDESTNLSKSNNTPYFNSELKGQCIGVINQKKVYFKDH